MSVLALKEIANSESVLPRLAEHGLSRPAAIEKAAYLTRAAANLRARGVPEDALVVACFVPGRVEVLGKHTDYAGGRSLLAAVERGFYVVAAPRSDERIHMLDIARDSAANFLIDQQLQPQAGEWSNYPMTVARRLARNFPGPLRGADIAFSSDLPGSAGMSSSSALIVATYLVLAAINDLPQRTEFTTHIRSPEDLAGYLGTIENGMSFGGLAGDRGVGTFGGSEDHTAILQAQAGRIVQYAYCPVRFERAIDVPEELTLAIAVSGIVADKTGAAMDHYNRVSRLAGAAVEAWREATGRDDVHLAAALAAQHGDRSRIETALRAARHPAFTAQELLDRFQQFYAESEEIIPAVPERLSGVGLARFSALVDRSQSLGAQLLRNQTPETIWLAEAARRLGALAASAFGAGFGGSVWALVPIAEAESLLHQWSDAYQTRFPAAYERAAFFLSRPGPGAWWG